MSPRPRPCRVRARWSAALPAACAMPLWTVSAGADEAADSFTREFASQLRLCLRTLRADAGAEPMGSRKVGLEERCPAVAQRIGGRPLPGMRGRWLEQDGSMTMRQLDDLQRLVEAAAEPKPYVGQLSSMRLAAIIDALDPAARGELSTRARLARWWRALVGEFDPTRRERGERRQRVEWPLGLWSSV